MAGQASARSSSFLCVWRRRVTKTVLILLSAATFVAGVSFVATPANAQIVVFPTRPKPIKPAQQKRPNGEKAPMLLQATEVQYDYTNKRVSAVNNVQIYHEGSTLEADKVIYDENTKRLRAEGNVRMTEPDGRITYADVMDLSDDFRDGFVDSLRLDTADATRMAAARADRSSGTFTVFHSGVYTACEPCKDDPKKPPTWQVKAARMIHDGTEKMIYFEDARLEFFGHPVAYMPYFSAPDPTVKRKSGFLMPTPSYSSIYGFGMEVPYYWALAPDYDVTFSPRVMSKQGVLLRGEFRQRLVDGAYSIRASGIYQLDRDVFLRDAGAPTPGYKGFRGSIETTGQFALTDRWTWGWDGILSTDPTYFQDYHLSTYQRGTNLLANGLTEGVSQLYLTGRGDRSYFDIRAMYFMGFSEADHQSQIPYIHPVMDYSYIFNNPVFGGELGYRANFTSLTRQSAAFDPISSVAFGTNQCAMISADPRQKTPSSCLLRGFPGTYTRASADVTWKRSITDQFGQVWTPFATLRADAGYASVDNQPGVSNFMNTGDNSQLRVMPTVGVEYRYPFINVQSWGTQTIEPMAQLIARPNETGIGRLPNEDSQSLIFDDTNLFRVDKFAGWDRAEGGGRANVGVQYTAQFNRGGFVNALFGQSYQLFGTNSFAVGDSANTGLNSGLDTDRSDYVARLMYQPDRVWSFTTRFRFDQSTFDVQRFETEARATFDRWSVSVLYGDYAPQPLLGFLDRRQGILTSGSIKLTQNWVANASVRYDLAAEKISGTTFGIGYIDDCLIVALNYMRNYTYSGVATRDDRIMLQMTLRTLGGVSVGQTVSSGQL
ncbi:LPS-assembly protein LptD [Rhodoplanes sp. Z2-YC6860]|uniref:LPS-assembly protein LptD n=1 Tax=Rhodoplanes sp. Z2-YC6860 TaxID=674703 RepID=UPI00078E7901|nr:LPS-assembly protein LptD [Rhodoplanes sp. Z2-YC6860]AMN42910.1 organic solvent tolerance protein OstA [Rhodoplanes sp. Z2-YC6860]